MVYWVLDTFKCFDTQNKVSETLCFALSFLTILNPSHAKEGEGGLNEYLPLGWSFLNEISANRTLLVLT